MDKNEWQTQENDKSNEPNILNYDYVWGSDQDEYAEQLKQSEDFAVPEPLELPNLGQEWLTGKE